MTQVTETQYETVEQEVDRYKCDHCGSVVDEEEIHTVTFIKGLPGSTARLTDGQVDEEHRCEGCVGINSRLESEDWIDGLKARWEALGKSISLFGYVTIPVLTFCIGTFGMVFAGLLTPPSGPTWALTEPILGCLVGVLMILVMVLVICDTE